MVKVLLSLIGLFLAINVQAAPTAIETIVQAQTAILENSNFVGLDWKVGDSATYDLTMMIFIKGTMTMSVASIEADGIWMHEDIDLGHGVKQQLQVLIDPTTGATKKIVSNGVEQNGPKQDIEVIDTVEEKITVPAGTFDSMHVIAKNKATTKNNDVNVWINPQVVPVGGTLKQVTPLPVGKMTTELRSFVKN